MLGIGTNYQLAKTAVIEVFMDPEHTELGISHE
jgi:hypothetical protein